MSENNLDFLSAFFRRLFCHYFVIPRLYHSFILWVCEFPGTNNTRDIEELSDPASVDSTKQDCIPGSRNIWILFRVQFP